MFEGIKKATGPAVKRTVPLKAKSGDVITDLSKQMERWVEHYSELYFTENTVSEEAINIIPALPAQGELDTVPTVAELVKAINGLASSVKLSKQCKAPGNDASALQIIKKGNQALLPHHHEVLFFVGRKALQDHQWCQEGLRACSDTLRHLLFSFADLRIPVLLCVYNHTRYDGKLCDLTRLGTREIMFADDVTFVSHTNDGLIDQFAYACKEFALTISIKKTEVMAQNAPSPPAIVINSFRLATVNNFRYLGSSISSNVSLDAEINAHMHNAYICSMYKLQKREWENKNLTLNTKMKVYQAYVLSTLLYGRETWTTYAKQGTKLNVFHMRYLRKKLDITWENRVTNRGVLDQAQQSTIFAMLSVRRLLWLGHAQRMEKGRIPKNLLYGQLERGPHPRGHPIYGTGTRVTVTSSQGTLASKAVRI
ncbi:hypothetical protein HOLleu_05708 [Holothuria leucospilota]|uniref:Reverse transcriptase domain-containing protein n=1 Tax=Holothuria leucospilota TaxID=206669 RepID=A0A9Q1CM21_HOLLE|nr:hypothetical protein HOLleu_05708 [Holothuria leucospilota]